MSEVPNNNHYIVYPPVADYLEIEERADCARILSFKANQADPTFVFTVP